MNETNTPHTSSGRSWGRVLLFVSLAVNLLIVGMIAGNMYQHRNGPPGTPDNALVLRDLGYGPYGRALSPPDRRKIGREMKDRASVLNNNSDVFRAQTVRLLRALRASPYRPEVVREILVAQSDSLRERGEIGRELLLGHFENMSSAERKSYAQRLEKMLRRPPRRR